MKGFKKRKELDHKASLTQVSKDTEGTKNEGFIEEDEAPTAQDVINPPKARRKRKTRKSKLDQEETGVKLEPSDEVLGLMVHKTDRLMLHPPAMYPLVRVHVMDTGSGAYLVKEHRERKVTSFYENTHKWEYILPVMTQQFCLTDKFHNTPAWEEMLVFNESFDYIVKNEKTILFFEVLDIMPPSHAKDALKILGSDSGFNLIAWGFLRPRSTSNSNFFNRRLRLQLFKPVPLSSIPSNIKTKALVRASTAEALNSIEMRPIGPSAKKMQDLEAGSRMIAWYTAGQARRRPYPATLHVTLSNVKLVDEAEMLAGSRSFYPNQREVTQSIGLSMVSLENLRKNALQRMSEDDQQKIRFVTSQWRRKEGQLCRIPNKKVITACFDGFTPPLLPLSARSAHFSKDGYWLALGTGLLSAVARANINMTSKDIIQDTREGNCPILVYNASFQFYPMDDQQNATFALQGHTKCVYDLCWADAIELPLPKDDNLSSLRRATAWLLASASSDGTARLWWLMDSSKDLLDAFAVCSKSNSESPFKAELRGNYATCVLGHPSFVYDVGFQPTESSSCSRTLVTTCYDSVVRVWAVDNFSAKVCPPTLGFMTLI
ncbi:Jouberin [Cichlidogyrus casuarinus]|uniref:Jouberin n=1 Tax=Cichlidogyrus casuarinus TaxID=1844966 RepID=A0ABD2PXX7_9PLAT